MTDDFTPRSLTHDEKKAADAAFSGRAFNPAWSAAARLVYDGILKILPGSPHDPKALEGTAPTSVKSDSAAQPPIDRTEVGDEGRYTEQTDPPATLKDIKQAIEAGILIDVTPAAQQLGISFPITITKPLWESGITLHQTLTEEDTARRLRDVLMAFRLRLSGLVTVTPLLEFPALLVFPPDTIPKPIPLFALIQPNEEHEATATLLLPNEVASTITPMV